MNIIDINDLNFLDALLDDLYIIIKSENQSGTKYAERTICVMRNNIRIALSQQNESENIFNILTSLYNSMFPPKSGLSEFYIWRNDYTTRCKLNSNYEDIKSQIGRILDRH